MSNSKKTVRKLRKYRRKSPQEKLEIVQEVNSGLLTGASAAEKYGVTLGTIIQWRKQVASGKGLGRQSYSPAFKRQIVTEIETGVFTIAEAAQEYQIKYLQSIRRWMEDPNLRSCTMADKNHKGNEHDPDPSMEAENEQLRKELEAARLKILGLETLIEVAEEELDIEIRKKSGTKQSKG